MSLPALTGLGVANDVSTLEMKGLGVVDTSRLESTEGSSVLDMSRVAVGEWTPGVKP